MPYTQHSENQKQEFKNHLNQYPWEWFVTLSLTHKNTNLQTIENHLKSWRLKIVKTEHIQLCHVGTMPWIPRKHIHLLMFGQNQSGKTLADVDPDYYSNLWPAGNAKISPIHDKEGIIDYLVTHNMPHGQYDWLQYNNKLLQRHT